MYYLVYLSSASTLLSEDELKDILVQSRENNTAQSITGMLLYMDGSIIQVLEGEEEKVKALYRKIALDPRHTRITRLVEGPLTERNFPDWSMGYRSYSPEEVKQLPGYQQISTGEWFGSDYSVSRIPHGRFLQLPNKPSRLLCCRGENGMNKSILPITTFVCPEDGEFNATMEPGSVTIVVINLWRLYVSAHRLTPDGGIPNSEIAYR